MNPSDELPISDEEAKRRLRAAAELGGRRVSSLPRVPGFASWARLGNNLRLSRRHAEAAASVLPVTVDWFLVPDLGEAVRDHAARLAARRSDLDEPGPTDRERREAASDDDAEGTRARGA